MIKKFKAAFGKNDHAHSTTDELDLFDFAYTPGDIVNTAFGNGTIVRAGNSFEKLAIELNEWVLNGNEKVMIFCNPLEVSLIRTSLQNNSDFILPPQSWFKQQKVNICSTHSSTKDELHGKDVVLQNTYGVDHRFVGYIGKVVDIGKDKRWRQVQLYPLAYKELRDKLEYYRKHKKTRSGEIYSTLEKREMESELEEEKDSDGMHVVTWKTTALKLQAPYGSIVVAERVSKKRKQLAMAQVAIDFQKSSKIKLADTGAYNIDKFGNKISSELSAKENNLLHSQKTKFQFESLVRCIIVSVLNTDPGLIFYEALNLSEFGFSVIASEDSDIKNENNISHCTIEFTGLKGVMNMIDNLSSVDSGQSEKSRLETCNNVLVNTVSKKKDSGQDMDYRERIVNRIRQMFSCIFNYFLVGSKNDYMGRASLQLFFRPIQLFVQKFEYA